MDDKSLSSGCNLAGIMAYHCTKYEVILVRIPLFTEIHSNIFLEEYKSVGTKITLFWYLMSCLLVDVMGRFRGNYCFHPQGRCSMSVNLTQTSHATRYVL
jgi:hypothetical protein